MNARKPHLLELLVFGARLLRPQRGHEVLAPLVQRQGMERVFDMRAEVGVEESIIAPEEKIELGKLRRDADRSDRVPHADAFDRDVLVAPVETLEHVGILVLFLVAFPQLQKAVEILLAEQSRIADQAPDAARRVGAARKAEQEDFIALAIVVADERVGIAQILRQAPTHRAPPDPPAYAAPRAP